MKRKGKTSQRTILFRQNVNRDNEEWAHFLEGYREWLMDWDMTTYGDDWHTAEDRALAQEDWAEAVLIRFISPTKGVCPHSVQPFYTARAPTFRSELRYRLGRT